MTMLVVVETGLQLLCLKQKPLTAASRVVETKPQYHSKGHALSRLEAILHHYNKSPIDRCLS